MTTFTVEIDHDMADRIVFENLADCRQRFLDDLGDTQRVVGHPVNPRSL